MRPTMAEVSQAACEGAFQERVQAFSEGNENDLPTTEAALMIRQSMRQLLRSQAMNQQSSVAGLFRANSTIRRQTL